MIVFNHTIKISLQIEKEWVEWQLKEHIPEIMATGLFDSFKLYHLLEQEETDGITFTIQYFTSSYERYREYIDTFSSRIDSKAVARWGNRFIGFRTAMELVD